MGIRLQTIILSVIVSIPGFSQTLKPAIDPDALYARAGEFLHTGNTRQAKLVFKKIIKYYSDENRVSELPEHYLGMALAFAFNEDYAHSIRFHKKALKAHHHFRPQESDDAIRMNLGLTYQLAGKKNKAKIFLPNPDALSLLQ